VLLNENTRYALMLYAPAKFGKTTMAATLDELTRKQLNKPTLFIPLEASDGGGTMSVRAHNLAYVIPETYDEMQKLIPALIEDTTFGGIVLDSGSEYVDRFVKPYALRFPPKDQTPTRIAGVPERSDYQTMGERVRQDFNRLMAVTKHPDPNKRKHLVVTALEKERTDSRGNLTGIVPDLPGAMALASAAVFQTVGSIRIVNTVVKDEQGKASRVSARMFSIAPDGIRIAGDRMNVLPEMCAPNLCEMWYTYVVPAFSAEPLTGESR